MSNLRLSGQMTCLFAVMQFQLNKVFKRTTLRKRRFDGTVDRVLRIESFKSTLFTCCCFHVRLWVRMTCGIITFMQDVSKCDSLSGYGNVFDLCLSLKQSYTSQVVLLYPQRGVT